MPIYEYRCNSCNIQFELRQKFSDPPADKCPKCGGTVHKLVSAVSFSLKGAGWYGDGYGTKAETTKSEGDTADGVAGATTEAAPADSAPNESASKETTESPVALAPAPSQAEQKNTVAEKTATVEKTKSE